LAAGIVSAGRGTLALVVPTDVSWVFPLYELALLIRERLNRERCSGVRVMVVTPEVRPLRALAPGDGEEIQALLQERGVLVRTDAAVLRFDATRRELVLPTSR
jgi:hypothetical protein